MANRIILSGRLTKDVVLRYTSQNTPVTTFTIAVDRLGQGNKEEKITDFFNCVVWNKLAETVSKYIGKGSKVLVEGRLQNQKYEKDGEKRVATEVIVNSIEFLDSKKYDQIKEQIPDVNMIDGGEDTDLPF